MKSVDGLVVVAFDFEGVFVSVDGVFVEDFSFHVLGLFDFFDQLVFASDLEVYEIVHCLATLAQSVNITPLIRITIHSIKNPDTICSIQIKPIAGSFAIQCICSFLNLCSIIFIFVQLSFYLFIYST